MKQLELGQDFILHNLSLQTLRVWSNKVHEFNEIRGGEMTATRPDNVSIYRMIDQKSVETICQGLLKDGIWVQRVDARCFKTAAEEDKIYSYIPDSDYWKNKEKSPE